MDNLDLTRENEININKYMSRPEINNKIQEMVNRGNKRLVINLDSLRDFNENLAKILLRNPLKLIPLFENNLQEQTNEALDDIKQKGQNTIRDNLSTRYRVTFEGTFGKNMISPRGLTSELVNQLVCIQGIVTRMSIVKPKLIRSVHYCEETKQGSVKEYDDQFSLSQRTNLDANFGSAKVAQYMSNTVPTKDMHGNPLSFEYGLSCFKDFQMLLVQEPPERTPVGQLPRSVEVILEEDLVDKVKPGDR
jgi:DNA replication licensing factor MCM3